MNVTFFIFILYLDTFPTTIEIHLIACSHNINF